MAEILREKRGRLFGPGDLIEYNRERIIVWKDISRRFFYGS